MSSTRKRLRPLDPAEERTITTSSWVRLSYLGDERSYCLSWPDSALTRFLSASTGYAAAHIYHSQTETELSARLGLSGSSTVTGRKTVPVPPVYLISDLVDSAVGDEGHGHPDSVAHLLDPSQTSGPIKTVNNPVVDPHPLAPPRPRTSTEDSILSLTCMQVQDAAEAGLLSSSCASGVTTSAEDCAKRRLLEAQVTGYEWRAFHESQRTGAALQRLLTLDAAVPLLPPDHAPQGTPSVEEAQHRGLIYELWLRWRLHSAGRLTRQETQCCVQTGRPTPVPVDSSLPECAWGTPLLCGAYLYGMQNDYFLSPLIAPGTAALQQQQHQSIDGTAATMDGGVSSQGNAVGTLDGTSFLTRRRGCYNFLRWRIERYLPRLRAAAGDAVDTEGFATVGSNEDARFGVRHNSAPLGAPQIDALVRSVVLRDSVLDVEMDASRETLQALEWTDLLDECKSWSTWLSKV